jgi:hypothetical protein
MKKKWTLAIGVTIGAMVFGMAAVAAVPFVAYAQTAATATTAPGVTATTAPSTNAGPGTNGAGPANGGDRQADLPGLQESDLVISATASVTGLTVQEVNTQLQAGQSVTQIAQAKGKTAADVIQAARAALATGLQTAVSAGTITQADADAELAEFDQRAPQMVADAGLNGQPGPGFGAHDGGGPKAEQALLSAAASVTGLTAQEVTTQLRAGQSLTQIATAKGKTAADVIAAARTALSTRLQQAVTAGTITQAQADAQLANFDTTAPQIVADTTLGTEGGRGFGRGDRGGPGGAGTLINATASVTGLTDQEIDIQLQAGQTLAQIAQSKGKTADDVIAAARMALTAQLAQDVTAGRITQAQSDAKLAQFNASATQLVNDATLGQHAGGPGGHRGGPGGPDGQSNPANPTPTAPAATTATNS